MLHIYITMKTRRSILKEKDEALKNKSSMQSVLFPIYSKNEKKIVPETPGNYNATCNSCTATVLETPDDINPNSNTTESDEDIHNFQNVSENSLNYRSDETDSSSLFEVTPDLKLTNRRGIISILESEYSKINSLHMKPAKNMTNNLNERGRKSLTDRHKRKSLAEKILPFDLNDESILVKKFPILNKSKGKRRRTTNFISENKKNLKNSDDSFSNKIMSTPPKSINGINSSCMNVLEQSNSSATINSSHIKLNGKYSGKRLSLRRNDTIIFEKSNDLDLTNANTQTNILLENSLSEAIQSLHTNTSGYQLEDSSSPKNISSQAAVLSFQKFSYSSDSINRFLEEKSQYTGTPNDVSINVQGSNYSPITNFNKEMQAELSPLNKGIFQDTFSPTQPACRLILLGVIAYVDVRSGAENRSSPIKETLISLGANVLNRFTMEVTHVVFRDGSKSTYERAIQKGVHLISPLWVDACRVKLVRVSESLFPISTNLKTFVIGIHSKPRKLKSMQPREFEEDELLISARIKKRLQSATSTNNLGTPMRLPSTPNTIRENVNSPLFGIEHLVTPHRECDASLSSVHASSEESDVEVDGAPLARRMYNRFISPMQGPVTSLKNDIPRIPLSPLINIVRLPNVECGSKSISPKVASNKTVSENLENNLLHCVNSDNRETSGHVSFLSSDESSASNRPNLEKSPTKKICTYPKLLENDIAEVTPQNKNKPIARRKSILKNVKASKRLSNLSNRRTETEESTAMVLKNTQISSKQCSLLERGQNVKSDLTSQISNVTKGSKLDSISENENTSSCSGLSQSNLTGTKKHRLHTVDFDIPSHDLIVPSTPRTPSKHQSCFYDNLCVQDSTTQRKAMKNFKKKELTCSTVLPLPRKVRRCSLDPTKLNHSISSSDVPTTQSNSKFLSNQQLSKSRFSLISKNRGSLEEFQSPKISRKRNSGLTQRSVPSKIKPSICVTSFHSGDLGSVYAIIKSLGGFKVTEEVEENTTHVVCGSERRTLNVLFGIAKGCWILDVSWLYESVELLKWAPEEPFEMFNFCPGAKKHRLKKKSYSSMTKSSLFSGIGRICVLDSCSPKLHVMKALLHECGSNLCSTIRSADLAVGEKKLDGSVVLQVSEKWVFDSIQHWNIQDFQNYILQ